MNQAGLKKLKPMKIIKFTRWLLFAMYYFSKIPWFTNFILYITRPLYVPSKETWFNRKIRYGFLTFGAGLLSNDAFRAFGYGAKAFQDNFDEVIKAEKEKKPIVWVEWILNAEILAAFEVTAFCSAAMNIFLILKACQLHP